MKRLITFLLMLPLCFASEAQAGFFDSLLHKAPAAPTAPVLPVSFITIGNGVVYSPQADKIAFSRYDPTIKGLPDPDGKVSNMGTFELWTADSDGTKERCLSCFDITGGPLRSQHKGAPTWHPSGRWLVVSVEMPNRQATHEQTSPRHGFMNDLWAVSTNGKHWYQLTHYANTATQSHFPDAPAGALKPHFTHAGGKIIWSEMVGGDAQHPFGIWQLAIADFAFGPNGAELRNKHVYKPGAPETSYYEASSFSPDDSKILISSDNASKGAVYMRMQQWDVKSNTLTPLTPATDQYEKQGIYSPDGDLIAYMSTLDQQHPYNPQVALRSPHTDIWIMRSDGSHAQRVTYFNQEGHPHHVPGQHLLVPVSWLDEHALLFDANLIDGGKQDFNNNKIYRLDLP